MNTNQKSLEIIKQFNLSPHPEGGWFREIVRSKSSLTRGDGQKRNLIREFIIFWREMKKVLGIE